jgi:hypothetical protein
MAWARMQRYSSSMANSAFARQRLRNTFDESAWNCRNCPAAADLLRWLDYLAAENSGLKAMNNSLRQKLAAARES